MEATEPHWATAAAMGPGAVRGTSRGEVAAQTAMGHRRRAAWSRPQRASVEIIRYAENINDRRP